MDDALFEVMFWLMFCLLFQKDAYDEKAILKKELHKEYMKAFLVCKIERDTALDLLPCAYAHAVVKTFIDTFHSNRSLFNKKFAFDVFRLVYLELQGITVTDIFITNILNRQFQGELLNHLEFSEIAKNNDIRHNSSRFKKEGKDRGIRRKTTMRKKEDIINSSAWLLQNSDGQEFLDELKKVTNPTKIREMKEKKNQLLRTINAFKGSLSKQKSEGDLRLHNRPSVRSQFQKSPLKTPRLNETKPMFSTPINDFDKYKTILNSFMSTSIGANTNLFSSPNIRPHTTRAGKNLNIAEEESVLSASNSQRGYKFNCARVSPFMAMFSKSGQINTTNNKFITISKESSGNTPSYMNKFYASNLLSAQMKMAMVEKNHKEVNEDPEIFFIKKEKSSASKFSNEVKQLGGNYESVPLLKEFFSIKKDLAKTNANFYNITPRHLSDAERLLLKNRKINPLIDTEVMKEGYSLASARLEERKQVLSNKEKLSHLYSQLGEIGRIIDDDIKEAKEKNFVKPEEPKNESKIRVSEKTMKLLRRELNEEKQQQLLVDKETEKIQNKIKRQFDQRKDFLNKLMKKQNVAINEHDIYDSASMVHASSVRDKHKRGQLSPRFTDQNYKSTHHK